MTFAVIITAAGKSRRIKTPHKKELFRLEDESVLSKTVKVFAQTGLFGWIAVTHPKESPELFHFLDKEASYVLHCPGGDTRQESVFNALEMLSEFPVDFVLVHDGARPWVSSRLIEDMALASVRFQAAIPVVASVDAVKQIEGEILVSHLPREAIFGAQTPQGFAFPLIWEAHRNAKKENLDFVDESSLFSHFFPEKPVHIVKGERLNKKITYCEDFPRNSKDFVGFGYDLHRLMARRDLVLAGVKIESSVGPLAYSDGDVLVHALIDAMLGALALGDIGEHFPNTDQRWKDARGLDLLGGVVRKMLQIKARLINVDATIILESPSLFVYKPRIKKALSEILNLDEARISIKAKTKEGVDAVGEQRAIECFVVVMVRKGENDFL